jgi:hypothetical protein
MAIGIAATLVTSATAQTSSTAFFGTTVNGTCEVGSCPPTAVQPGSSDVTTPFDYTVTLANGDRYHFVGTDHQVNQGGCASFSALGSQSSIQYVGNDAGTPSAADTLTVETWRNWACTVGGIYIYAAPNGAFSPDVGPGTSVELTVDAKPPIHMGPYTAPNPYDATSPHSTPIQSGGVVKWHATTTLKFGAGSAIGSYVGSGGQPAPGPVKPAPTPTVVPSAAQPAVPPTPTPQPQPRATPPRVVQSPAGDLFLVQSNSRWLLVPDPIDDANLGAFNMAGELDGTVGPQPAPPRIVQAGDGSLYLLAGQAAWALVPDQIGDSDLADLDLSGELDGAIPGDIVNGTGP